MTYTVHEFRSVIRDLFDGLTDNQIMDRIERNRSELFEYCLFENELQNIIGGEFERFDKQVAFSQILDRVRELANSHASDKHESISIPDHINQSYRVLGLEEMQSKIQSAMAFQEQVKQLLCVDSDDEALEKIKGLWINEDCDSALTQLRIDRLEKQLAIANKVITRLVNE